MVPAGADPPQRRPVRRRPISGVAVPAIGRVAPGQPRHRPVPHDLGHDGCRGDGQGQAIAARPRTCTGQGRDGAWLPSTRARSGQAGSRQTARRIASNEACRMFNRAMSGTDAAPTPIHAPLVANSGESSFPCRRIQLSSSHPATPPAHPAPRRGNTTAAATTGPASGPRPASSTPATMPPCSCFARESLAACPDATSRRLQQRELLPSPGRQAETACSPTLPAPGTQAAASPARTAAPAAQHNSRCR